MTDRVVLFDMDGTLTAARKTIEWSTVTLLRDLSKHAKIGIVTGSDLNYLLEQCGMMWREINSCNPNNVILLPCNGTKRLDWNTKAKKFKMSSSVDMREQLGEVIYRRLIEKLVKIHDFFISYTKPSCPLTGTFFSYRGSLLNYCPIGRDANDKDREDFATLDQNNIIRGRLIEKLKEEIDTKKECIEVRLGGETSIDIFPKGWDKTYALKHFDNSEIYFVGDRCVPGGNDYDLYLQLGKDKRFKTVNTKNTREIIASLIKRFEEE